MIMIEFAIACYTNQMKKLKKENIIKGQVTFLVSASLLKERGALIICRKENRFLIMNHRNNHENVMGTNHNFLFLRDATQCSNVRERPRFSLSGSIAVQRRSVSEYVGMKEPLMTYDFYSEKNCFKPVHLSVRNCLYLPFK